MTMVADELGADTKQATRKSVLFSLQEIVTHKINRAEQGGPIDERIGEYAIEGVERLAAECQMQARMDNEKGGNPELCPCNTFRQVACQPAKHKSKQGNMKHHKENPALLGPQPAGEGKHPPLVVRHGIQFMGKQQADSQEKDRAKP